MHKKPDVILSTCCVVSLILVPIFFIGVTVVLFSIAVAGEIAGRVRGRKTGLVDARTIAIRMCHGRGHEKPRALSFPNIHF